MTDEVRELPEEVRREIAKHHEQYRTDPDLAATLIDEISLL